MAIIPQKPLFCWQEIEDLRDLDRLRLVLGYLPDEPLMLHLEADRGRGRDDYPVRAVWNSVLAGIVFQHPSAESLRRELQHQGDVEGTGPDAGALRASADRVRPARGAVLPLPEDGPVPADGVRWVRGGPRDAEVPQPPVEAATRRPPILPRLNTGCSARKRPQRKRLYKVLTGQAVQASIINEGTAAASRRCAKARLSGFARED